MYSMIKKNFNNEGQNKVVKFVFSEKSTKIDEIFTVDLTVHKSSIEYSTQLRPNFRKQTV